MGNDDEVAGSELVRPRAGRSWRRDSIFEHRAALRVVVKTADGDKYLGDCTREDLRFVAAAERKRQLRQIVYVGGKKKFLGDCTREDLLSLAAECRSLADELQSDADSETFRAPREQRAGA